jgi:4-hydroxybutyrate CoA-transferase
MRIGLKYCGGCNPRYERSIVATRLRDDFPAVELVRAEGAVVDIVAVICGCPVACASHDHLCGKLEKIVITRAEDYEALCRLVSSH